MDDSLGIEDFKKKNFKKSKKRRLHKHDDAEPPASPLHFNEEDYEPRPLIPPSPDRQDEPFQGFAPVSPIRNPIPDQPTNTFINPANEPMRALNYVTARDVVGEEIVEYASSCEEGDNEDQFYEDERQQEDRSRCLFCGYHSGIITFEIEGKAINDLVSFLYDNFGDIPNRELARQLHLQYKETIQNPSREKGKYVPSFTSKQIFCHLEYHTNDPRAKIKTTIEDLENDVKAITRLSYSSTDLGNGSQRFTCEPKLLKLKLEFIREIRAQKTQRPKTMVFYSENQKFDLSKMGPMVKFGGPFSKQSKVQTT